jgi:hypothetical protein
VDRLRRGVHRTAWAMGFEGRPKSGFDFLRPIAQDMWTEEHYARTEQPGGASGRAGGIQSRSARQRRGRPAWFAAGWRVRQLDRGEIRRMDHPLANDSTDAVHVAPGRNAALDVHTARPRRRDVAIGRVGAHKSPRLGRETASPGPWRPQSPLAWRHESESRAACYPKTPSGGVTNRSLARLGAHNPPSHGATNRNLATPVTQRPARVASQIAVSRGLAPTIPLAWRHESESRNACYPKTPSGGVTNRSLARLGTHNPPRMAPRIAGSRRLGEQKVSTTIGIPRFEWLTRSSQWLR